MDFNEYFFDSAEVVPVSFRDKNQSAAGKQKNWTLDPQSGPQSFRI
jgi:hypothetical protein